MVQGAGHLPWLVGGVCLADGRVQKAGHAGQHREGRTCLLHPAVVSIGCSVLLHCVLLLLLLQVAYDQLSPLHAARSPAAPGMSQFVPPVLLLHGTTDKSVPFASSLLLNDALQAACVDTRVSAVLECVFMCCQTAHAGNAGSCRSAHAGSCIQPSHVCVVAAGCYIQCIHPCIGVSLPPRIRFDTHEYVSELCSDTGWCCLCVPADTGAITAGQDPHRPAAGRRIGWWQGCAD